MKALDSIKVASFSLYISIYGEKSLADYSVNRMVKCLYFNPTYLLYVGLKPIVSLSIL